MNYCSIEHTSKNVSFRNGTKAKEFYYHIKTKDLITNYSNEFDCVKACRDQMVKSGIGGGPMTYGECEWNTLIGWRNYTIQDLCNDIFDELIKRNHPNSLGRPYDRWAGSIKQDGLYLNVRIYENI